MKQQPHIIPVNPGPAALRAVFNILARWQLRPQDRQSLLGVPNSTYFRWKKDPDQAQVDADKLERLSYILGIYKGLHLIYSDEAIADGWLKRANTNALFGGKPPLDRLLAGHVADLYVIRQHIDARRGII